ncbi:MAG: hypothetical protein VST68_07215, partial [Nitrospirota bacterium]|nr:hypothetical protein [Nitrospirota bacterium]
LQSGQVSGDAGSVEGPAHCGLKPGIDVGRAGSGSGDTFGIPSSPYPELGTTNFFEPSLPLMMPVFS